MRLRVRLASHWRKSSYSGQYSDCVEVGRTATGAAVRDTKNRDAGILTATHEQWASFITAIKSGRYPA